MQDKVLERWQRLNKFMPTVAKLLNMNKQLFLGNSGPVERIPNKVKSPGPRTRAFKAARRRKNRMAHAARMVTWGNA
jgi:hypothetical protein